MAAIAVIGAGVHNLQHCSVTHTDTLAIPNVIAQDSGVTTYTNVIFTGRVEEYQSEIILNKPEKDARRERLRKRLAREACFGNNLKGKRLCGKF
jgi:hypothetical protein